jgi:hypothetical protein
MGLARVQTDSREINQIQSNIATILNPIQANPMSSGIIVDGIVLASGSNVIQHTLGRILQGYIVILKSANVTIYDSQSTNATPNLTLVLVSSGAATISLYLF